MRYPTISMRELEQWMSSGRPMLLVDLRTKREYDQGHLRGAVCHPFDLMEEWAEELPEGAGRERRGKQNSGTCRH